MRVRENPRKWPPVFIFFDGKQETVCGYADGMNNSSRSYKVESILAAERVWVW